jgi:hypothetical protein
MLAKVIAFDNMFKICENLRSLEIVSVPGICSEIFLVPGVAIKERLCATKRLVPNQEFMGRKE